MALCGEAKPRNQLVGHPQRRNRFVGPGSSPEFQIWDPQPLRISFFFGRNLIAMDFPWTRLLNSDANTPSVVGQPWTHQNLSICINLRTTT